MEQVEPRREVLVQKIRLREGQSPSVGVLAFRNARPHVLPATEEIGLRERDLGQEPFGGRITARQADRTGRLVLDGDRHDDAVGAGTGTRRNVNGLEEAQIVQVTLALLDQRVVVGVAFADVELPANYVVARTRVADDVHSFDIDLRSVVHGERQRDLMGRIVTVAVRPNVGKCVPEASQLSRHRLDGLFDRRGVIDVSRMQKHETLERLAADLRQMRRHGYAGDVILSSLRHRDRDDVTFFVGIVDHVRIGDAEVGITIFHIILADSLLVGGERVRLIDVGALEPGQEVHLGGLHQTM